MMTLIELAACFIVVRWLWKKYQEHQYQKYIEYTLGVGAGIDERHNQWCRNYERSHSL